MEIVLGADHRGWKLKEEIKRQLAEAGLTVSDQGPRQLDPQDDYPDFAWAVGERVAAEPENRIGVLLCGSGAGMVIAVNKVKGVRAAQVRSTAEAIRARREDNINIITLAADHLQASEATKIILAVVHTEFSEEPRHQRRVNKIIKFENNLYDKQ